MSCLVWSGELLQGTKFSPSLLVSCCTEGHEPHRSLVWPSTKQIQVEGASIWAKHVSSNTSSKRQHPGKELRRSQAVP